jgi:hypothetical protein
VATRKRLATRDVRCEKPCGLLRSAGIECFYRETEAIDSPLEDFIAAGQREIVVREADADAAESC